MCPALIVFDRIVRRDEKKECELTVVELREIPLPERCLLLAQGRIVFSLRGQPVPTKDALRELARIKRMGD